MTKLLDERSGQNIVAGNDHTTNFLAHHSNNNLVDILNNFYFNFYGGAGEARDSIRNFINSRDATYDIQAPSNRIRWISLNRNTGVVVPNFENPNELLNGLVRFCLTLNGGAFIDKSFRFHDGQEDVSICFLEHEIMGMDLTPENCLVLSSRLNNVSLRKIHNYLKAEQEYRDNCQTPGAPDTVSPNCRLLLNNKRKWDPERVHKKSFVSRFRQTAGYDINRGDFDPNHGNILDANTLSVSSVNNRIMIYNLQINPKALKMNANSEGSFFYRSYQQWFDGKPIVSTKDGNPFEIVNVNVISLDSNPAIVQTNLNLNSDLWTASENPLFRNANSALIFNGGYFIVPQNINTLTDITLDNFGVLDPAGNLLWDRLKPIGFFFSRENLGIGRVALNPVNGTHLPIPKAYSSYFAVIYKETVSNMIRVVRHSTFIRAHRTINVTCGYILDDGKYYITKQPVIRMRNGLRTSQNNEPDLIVANPEGILAYDWAFCTGPIYIMDGNQEFNIETLTGKQFLIDDSDIPADAAEYAQVENRINTIASAHAAIPDPLTQITRNKPPNFTRYRIDPAAKNNFMFKYSDNSDNFGFPMRNSNRLIPHSIIGAKDGRMCLIFVEGRGYSAPGLERSQISHLCKNIGMQLAVSLDGGYSGDAIYKIDGGQRKYIQDFPERRGLGLSITMAYP
jgi:hypothetical protein